MLVATGLVVWYAITPPNYLAAAALGQAQLAQSRPVEALRAVAEVQGPGPGAGEALVVAAKAFLRLGKREDARRALERALVYEPNSAEIARVLAPFRIMDGDTAGALDLLRRAAQLEPTDVRPWRAMGKLHFTRMEYPESLNAYREAVRRDAKDHESRIGLIKILLHHQLTDEAATWTESALADEPNDPVVLGMAAHQAFMMGRLDEATAVANRALAHQPDNLDALMARGESALIENRPEQARVDAEHATRVDPIDIAAIHLLSQAEFRLGLTEQARATAAHREQVRKLREAIANLGMRIARNPKDASLHVLMGRAAALGGVIPLAAESYRAALALDPRSREAAEGLASLRAATAVPTRGATAPHP